MSKGKTKNKDLQRKRWWDSMIERYGSREKVQQMMRENGARGGKKSTGGGFTKMDKETLRKVSSKGGKKSRRSA